MDGRTGDGPGTDLGGTLVVGEVADWRVATKPVQGRIASVVPIPTCVSVHTIVPSLPAWAVSVCANQPPLRS